MKGPLPDLPVLEAVPALKAALARGRSAVLAAPPGSGKTTLVPLTLLDEPWLAGRKIVLLEPRRLAARAAARRMAQLRDEPVGETVGYQVRFERRISARTRIEVITEGLLTRRLQADPELPGVGLVIFDEFHERSLDVDLALALALDARANLNPDLRVLVMSATLDTAAVARLLGGAPVVESAGRLHPVEVRYRPVKPDDRIGDALGRAVLGVLGETGGDVLAFLPGAREIRDAQRLLEEKKGQTLFSVHPLYGDLSSADQDAALMPARDGRRKVILATNIAQTSLTVEGVTTVVDSGYVRAARFDLGAGANRLDTLRVSRASAEQRSGRAGRLGPGTAYRLWSEEQHGRLPAHDTPEILAADLTRFALELAAWGASPEKLTLADAPPAAAWSYAQDLLRELGAVDAAGRVTQHGRELSRLPTAPRLAHMLLLAQQAGIAPTAAWLAALLEDRGADSTDAASALRRARDSGRMRDAVRQMLRLLDIEGDARAEDDALGRAIAWAFPERIARRRAGSATSYLCEDGGEARLPDRDALGAHEWLAVAHWDPAPPRKVRLAAPLDFADVERDHAGRIRKEMVVRWDAQAEAVVAEEQTRLGAIVLARRDRRSESGDAVREAMLAGIRQMGLGALPWSEGTRQWQARVLSLRAWRKDEAWPDVSEAALVASLDWLAPFLDGVTRRAHLAQLDLAAALNAMLDYPLQQKLARLAPTHWTVPTGSHIGLEYFADAKPPALHVKLQEMFGTPTSPAVNDGRTPIVLHLLSPGQRPVAVTSDLAGFWTRGYLDVKKDMKGRYPRHPWPDDPVAAAPTRRAKPRGT